MIPVPVEKKKRPTCFLLACFSLSTTVSRYCSHNASIGASALPAGASNLVGGFSHVLLMWVGVPTHGVSGGTVV